MIILGISAFYHDAASALVINGEIVAAAQEERFTRKKHDQSYPKNAIDFCLKFAGISAKNIDYVTFYDKPYSKFERLLATYFATAPRGFESYCEAIPLWLYGKLFQKNKLIKELQQLDGDIDWSRRLLFSEHHLSHAASAFFPSPFERAAVLTMDGIGEWTTTSLAIGNGKNLDLIREIHFPHSLGLLYSSFTYYLGFKVNSGEYKVMGLAPYGEPRYVDIIKTYLIDIKEDGSFHLNLDYFDYCGGLRMTNERFHMLFGAPPRSADSPLAQREMDLAASIQAVTEEVVIKLARSIAKETGERNLCLAGGVALNCVANGKLLRERIFDNIWIQPASGDAGGALGAALVGYHCYQGEPRTFASTSDAMKGSYLGPEYSQSEIEERLIAVGARFEVLAGDDFFDSCATALVEGKAIGWHQGRMEFGPRALGARSIIGDARAPTMQKLLNLKVKYRESFRPFAPSILREDVEEWFDIDVDSPYMMMVADVNTEHRITMTDEEVNFFGIDKLNIRRSSIPAVTHVDYSARIQTVHSDTNPKYYSLISKFKEMTGCPIVVNTSFNVRGEPIVNTPEDAFRCFMGTGIDMLAIGNCILRKEKQDASFALNYRGAFELD
jgi:carbamoyltransferase